MLSKSAEKYINSLRIKKQRYVEKKYIAEGPKMALEYLKSNATISEIYATDAWISHHHDFLEARPTTLVNTCESFELKKVSVLTTPSDVLLICDIPNIPEITPIENEVLLALDNIQDPGNMGTIIRTADWMGIKNIMCHTGCVDIYNAKVVQATMGSLLRVNVFETDLEKYLSENNLPVYAGVLDGENILNVNIQKPCLLLVGNEGNGIQTALLPYIDYKITIPAKGNAESLNAAMAAGIMMALFCLK